MSKEWSIGTVVFGPDRKPVPIITSQGGKPYNFDALKALADRAKLLEAELTAARSREARLRAAADALASTMADHRNGCAVPHMALDAALSAYRETVAPASPEQREGAAR